MKEILEILMKEIFRLHGVPKKKSQIEILRSLPCFGRPYLSDCIQTCVSVQLIIHKLTKKRTNQILEDMLKIYAMEKPNNWEYYLHLVEFAYNNG